MKTALYSELLYWSNQCGETNDCTVKAVAVAAGVHYTDAHEAMKKAGRRNMRGAYKDSTMKALKSLGCEVEVVVKQIWCRDTYRWTADKNALKELGMGKTIKTAMSSKVDKNAHFVIFTRGHAVGATGGQIHDWTNGRQHRIKQVWKVTRPSDEPATPVVPMGEEDNLFNNRGKLTNGTARLWAARARRKGWTKSHALKQIRAAGNSISVARWNEAWNA